MSGIFHRCVTFGLSNSRLKSIFAILLLIIFCAHGECNSTSEITFFFSLFPYIFLLKKYLILNEIVVPTLPTWIEPIPMFPRINWMSMLSAAGVQVHIMIIISNSNILFLWSDVFPSEGLRTNEKKKRKERPASWKSSYETITWCCHIFKISLSFSILMSFP